MIVADASAVADYLLGAATAGVIAARLFAPGQTMNAPHILDLEILQVIRRHAARGFISVARGQAALDDLLDLPLIRHPHTLLAPRIWELRDGLTAYDAAYVSLAEVLSAPLLTCDRRLAGAAGHRAHIELI